MAFDYQKAIADGATDAEISDYLASKHKFDVGAARKDGAPDSEIVQYLLSKEGANTPKQTALPVTDPNKKTVASDALTGLMQIPQAANVQAQNIGASAWQWLGENLDVVKRPMAEEAKKLDPSYQVDDNAITKYGKQQVEATNSQMRALDANLAQDGWGRLIQGAGVSTVQNLANMGAAVLAAPATGGASAIPLVQNMTLGMMGAQSGLQGYADSRAKGFDVTQSNIRGAGSGGLEVATEKAPLGKFMDIVSPGAKIGIKSLMKKIGEYGLQDIGGELINTLVGDVIYEKAVGKPDMTDAEAIQAISDYFESGEAANNAKDTFWQTVIQSAMMGGVGAGVNRLTRNSQQQPAAPSATPVDSAADREAALAEQRRGIPIGPDTDLLNPASQTAAIPTPYTGPIEDSEAATPIDRLYSELARMGRENASGLGDIIPGRDVVVPVAEDFDMVGSATPAQAIPVQEQAPIELTTDDMLTPPTAIPTTAGMYGIPDTQFGAIPTGAAPSADSQVLGEQIDAANLTVGQDVALDRFTKQSPVAPPDNPAFLKPTGVVQNKDGSYTIAQPKAEPVTVKDLPEIMKTIATAYDNGHAMEDYAIENFGKVNGKVYVLDADSMTPVADATFSKEELLAKAQAKLAPKADVSGAVKHPTKDITYSVANDAKNGNFTIQTKRADGSGSLTGKAYATKEEAFADIPAVIQQDQDRYEAAKKNSPEAVKLADEFEALGDYGRAEGIIAHASKEAPNAMAIHNNSVALAVLKRQTNGTPVVKGVRDSFTLRERIGEHGYQFDKKQFDEYMTLNGSRADLVSKADELSQQITSAINDMGFKLDEINPHTARNNQKVLALSKAYKELFQSVLGLQKQHYPVLKKHKKANKDRATESVAELEAAIKQAQDILGIQPTGVPEVQAASSNQSLSEETKPLQPANTDTKYELPKGWKSDGTTYTNKAGDRATRKKDGTWNVHDVLGGAPDNVPTLDDALEALAANEEITLKERTDVSTPKAKESGSASVSDKTGASSGKPDMVQEFKDMLSSAIASDGKVDKFKIKKKLADLLGITYKQLEENIESQKHDYKGTEEQIETAVVMLARDIMAKNIPFADKLAQLTALYNAQPRLTHRTGKSKELQQYSTPVPMSGVINEVVGVPVAAAVYEPTAGNGSLLIGADPATVTANELDERRNGVLNQQGFKKVLNADAMEDVASVRDKSQDVVVMNPPFGKADDALTVDGVELTQREHIIAAQALDKMKDNGSAAIIIGGHNFEKGKMTNADWAFFNWLYNHYNVEHNVNVDGALYGRQGTTYPVRVITINGRKTGKQEEVYIPQESADQRAADAGVTDVVVKSWDQLHSTLKEKGNENARTAGDNRTGDGKLQDDGATDAGVPEHGGGLEGRGDNGSQRGGTGSDNQQPVGKGNGQSVDMGTKPDDATGRDQRDGTIDAGYGRGESGARSTGERVLKPEYEGFDPVALQAIIDVLGEDAVYDMAAEPTMQDIKASQKRTKDAIKQAKNTVKDAQKTAQPSAAAAQPTRTAAEQVADIFADFSLTEDDANARWNKALPAIQKALDEAISKANMATAKVDDLVRGFVTDFVTQVKTALENIGRTAQDIARSIGAIAPRLNKFVAESRSYIQDKINEATGKDTHELQAAYPQRSKGWSSGKLAPKNMADLMDKALDTLEKKVGSVDDYVMDKLQLDSKEALFKAFSGEQIDAVALAINAIENRQGVIIGDQTGVGKGRVAAAVILYAKLNGMKPVFVTEKPKLFSDINRDMLDILKPHSIDELRPYIMGTNTDSNIVTGDGEILYPYHNEQNHPAKGKRKTGAIVKPSEHQAKVAKDVQGELAGFDYVVTTYSQLGNPIDSAVRRGIFRELANDSIVVLDEAHNAAGSESQIGEFMRDALATSRGVTYLSATYAKRPDSMALYKRTALGTSGMTDEEFIETMASGGVPMQQILSSMLAEGGQYIRRENDYTQMERPVNYVNDSEEATAELERKMDATTEILRDIVEFSEAFGDHVKQLKNKINAKVTRKEDRTGLSSRSFAGVVHNYVRQLTLAMKVDEMVDQAMQALNDGYKPIFYVDNTMNAFIKDYAQENDIKMGDVIDPNFGDVMMRALNKTMTYNIKKPGSPSEKVVVTYDELPSQLQAMYDDIAERVEEYDFDVSGSPLDSFFYKLKARYKAETGKELRTAEITGRDRHIDMSGDQPVLASRDDKDRNAVVNGFNNGTVDVLLFNQAGATGLSLHPTKDTRDQRPRRMMVVQPSLNIDVYLQALGRTFRTGQIHKPQYVNMALNVPSETRPAIIQNRKLASINANLAAKAEGVFTNDVPDMDNSYGDYVVEQYLRDHPEVANMLGMAVADDDTTDETTSSSVFGKFTGKLAIMPVAIQREAWAELVQAYKSHIEYLDEMGENKLVAKDHDIKAKTHSVDTLTEKTGDGMFQTATNLETVEANVLKRPFKFQKVEALIAEELDGKNAVEYGDAITETMQQAYEAYVLPLREELREAQARERAATDEKSSDAAAKEVLAISKRVDKAVSDYNKLHELLQELQIGSVYEISLFGDDGGRSTVTLLGINYKPGNTGSPMAPSKLSFTFAVAGPTQKVTIPASKSTILYSAHPRRENRERLAELWNNLTPDRATETRHIVTGNLLEGMKKAKGHGNIVYYTTADGKTQPGILINQTKTAKEWLDQVKQSVTIGIDKVRSILSDIARLSLNTPVKINGSANGAMSWDENRKRWRVSFDGTKQGQKFYSDRVITDLSEYGRFDMSRQSGRQYAYFENSRINAVIDRMAAIANESGLPAPTFNVPRNLTQDTESTPAFSQATSDVGAGVSMANLKSAIATMQQMFPGVKIVVHNSPADVSWAPPTARGAYYKGEVHLFRSNIKDSSQAALTVLAHEFTHHGLDSMGVKGKQLLNQIALAHADEVKKIMAIRNWKDTPENRVRAANELVAQHGETKLKPTWWNRVKEFLQAAVSKITGKPVKLGLIDEAIREIRGQAKLVQKTGSMSLQPAFSENNPSNQNIKDDTVNSKEGSQYEDLSRPTREEAESHTRIVGAVRKAIKSGVQRDAGTGPDGQARREASLIRLWAVSSGKHFDPQPFTDAWTQQHIDQPDGIYSGAEQQVLVGIDENGNKIVTKRKHLLPNETWSTYLDRLDWHNQIFPDTAYQLEGFSTIPAPYKGMSDTLMSRVKQPFIERKTRINKKGEVEDVPATEAQIRAFMEYKGFKSFVDPQMKSLGDKAKEFKYLKWVKGDMVVSDLHPGNIWLDANNKIRVFDPVVERATVADLIAASEQDELDSAISIPLDDGTFYSQTTDDVSMVRKAYEWAITTAKEFVTSPAKALGDKYRMERYQTAGAIDAHNIEARLLLNRLTPLRESSNSSQKQVVYDFLTTVNADPSAITNPDVRAAAVEAKQKIMDIGETLVQMGLMKRETLEKRDGSYLPRLYMYHLLGTEEASRIEMLSGGKTLDFGFLKQRNELLSEEIRTNLLHEIKDPAYLVFMALSRPQKDMATYEWLASIAANPGWAMPKQLAEWNMSENPTYLIGNDIQYTVNEDGTYNIDQRIVKHERIAHKNVDLAFIKQAMGPNNAAYIGKNASAEWQTIGQIKFRMNNKGGFELSVAVKRVTDVTHTSIHPDDLDGIVGDKRADWMRTGRMTTLNGKSVPVRTKDGKRVTAFWLAAEAKRLQHVLAHDRGMAEADRAKSQRIIDRMYDLANATAAAMGYPMDADGNIIPKMPDGWKQIPQSKRYGKLSGLVVRREVYNDLVGKIGRDRDQMTKVEKFFSPDADGVLMQSHQLWKKYKTTYNIPTHITNFTSNAVMTHLFTDMNLREIPTYMMMAVQSILKKDQYWNYAVRNGITSASFTNNELGRANMELIEYMASQESTNATPMEKIAHFADILRAKKEKADQVAGDLYQMSETIWKIAIMRHQMDKHGIPAKQAALIAHDTLFDYSDVGPALRFLRQSYLGVPFATFMVKSSEMIVKKFIEDTTKSKAALTKPGTYGDKAMALWVATRFTRKMAVWNAIMLAAPYALASMIGLDGDDWEDYQKVMPQFFADKLHPMIMPLKDGDGRLTFFDLGKFTPWGPAGNVIKPVLRGDLTKAAKNAGFMQTPLVEAIVAFKTGKDAFTGKDIWEDTDTPAEKFGGALKFIYNLYAPSMIAYGHGPAYKTWHAFSGEVNPKTGDPKSNAVDAVGSWMGTGMRTMNVESERRREIDTRELAIAKLRGKETIAIRSANANDGDVRQVREHYRKKIDKLENELHEYKKGAKFDRSKF